MAQQIPLGPEAIADIAQRSSDGTHQVASDLAYKRLAIVNVVFFGLPSAGDRQWVLIDTGVVGTVRFIQKAAAERFGEKSRPGAIIMTHGHFDHVGGLPDLADQWEVPVYAHDLELPYLNGSASYPPADPTVGGGLMSLLSPLYPRGPVDVGHRLSALPVDGAVPEMPGWRWIHTPGHAVGHVSLWREADRTIIAGDAFITTAQESAYAVTTQEPELHGPPMYYTHDWQKAKSSVQALAALRPELAVTGHGPAVHGEDLRRALTDLAQRFNEVAVPEHGKYVDHPARAEDGSAYKPA